MQKGNIVLVRFPFTDLSAEKLRPAVVLVGEDELGDVCLAFVTSRRDYGGKYEVTMEANHNTGLKVPSTLRLSKIATIHSELIVGKIGQVPDELLEEMDYKLKLLFQLR